MLNESCDCWPSPATLLAVVGVAQYLFGNGKFLWIYQHPYRDTFDAVQGPFIDKNHFAHLLALGVTAIDLDTAASPAEPRTRRGRLLWWFGVGKKSVGPGQLSVGAGRRAVRWLDDASRGGIVVMAIAVLLCTAAMFAVDLSVGVWRLAC